MAYYKGPQIEIDLEKKRYKRDSDKNWMRLLTPKYIVLTQRRMQQIGGLRGSWITHKYEAFCVYIKAGNLNILAYQGKRDRVIEEAEKLSQFLDVKVKDLFKRDADGNIIDDDSKGTGLSPFEFFLIIIVLFALLGIMAALKD